MRLGDQTVQVVQRPAPSEDAYGNPTYDWTSAVVRTVGGCSVQPVDGDEQTVGRDTVVYRWRLWAPDGTAIGAEDRVIADGSTYDVDGPAQRWDFPPMTHLTCLLRRP